MSTHRPDKWVLVKVNGDDPHYRVFGVWFGGLLYGDSWRLNSGVTRAEEKDGYYHFYGSSGSEYICNKETEGNTSLSINILSGLPNSEVVETPEDVENFDWII